MGGHAAGEVASSVAVREVRRVIAENREMIEAYNADESAKNREKICRCANRPLKQRAHVSFNSPLKTRAVREWERL